MSYYHDLVTEKSWTELKNLHNICDFTLLGGWAVYLYTQGLKSKDIDILVDYEALPKLKLKYEFVKNDRLHKYEAIRGPVQIDIYTPHYSEIGIPIEVLLSHTRIVSGFSVINPEYLIALKLFTLMERGRTPKGRKDFLDLLSLYLALGTEPLKNGLRLSKKYNHPSVIPNLINLIGENTSLPELSLNPHKYANLKKSILATIT
jgi:hypothetical protein